MRRIVDDKQLLKDRGWRGGGKHVAKQLSRPIKSGCLTTSGDFTRNLFNFTEIIAHTLRLGDAVELERRKK